MDFEFGQTAKSEAFLNRHPKFFPAFEGLIGLSNKCFGRAFQPKNRMEDVCFNLGQACNADFLELMFLGANGYGIGALKTLRGFYERAVALAYIIKHPDKADRFTNFAAIQEYKAIKVALEVVSEAELDQMMQTKELSVARAKELYEKFKPEFQETACKKCKSKRTAISWDIDLASMVRDVGEPYNTFYLLGYVLPNFHVHATLASTLPNRPSSEQLDGRNREEAAFALKTAVGLLLLVIQAQNSLFSLNLEAEVVALDKVGTEMWGR